MVKEVQGSIKDLIWADHPLPAGCRLQEQVKRRVLWNEPASKQVSVGKCNITVKKQLCSRDIELLAVSIALPSAL